MAQLQTVSAVTKSLGISNRMIRYYEQISLIQSQRIAGYAYRVYDEDAIHKLRQIIVLRKLRIPMKQICEIFACAEAVRVIEIFERSICDLDNEVLSRLADRDVRIVYLPPVTVAVSHYVGANPHQRTAEIMRKFVIESDLSNIKPDMRHYGFNSPNCKDTNSALGYEMWTTIPDDIDVPAPLTKKRFEGGLYGAHMILMDGFNDWELLFEWCHNNEKYEYRGNMSNDNMFGCLEEVLNYKKHVCTKKVNHDDIQFDLLIPIKEKEL